MQRDQIRPKTLSCFGTWCQKIRRLTLLWLVVRLGCYDFRVPYDVLDDEIHPARGSGKPRERASVISCDFVLHRFGSTVGSNLTVWIAGAFACAFTSGFPRI